MTSCPYCGTDLARVGLSVQYRVPFNRIHLKYEMGERWPECVCRRGADAGTIHCGQCNTVLQYAVLVTLLYEEQRRAMEEHRNSIEALTAPSCLFLEGEQ